MPAKRKAAEDPPWIAEQSAVFFAQLLPAARTSDLHALSQLRAEQFTKGLCIFLFQWVREHRPEHTTHTSRALFLIESIPALRQHFTLDRSGALALQNERSAFLRDAKSGTR